MAGVITSLSKITALGWVNKRLFTQCMILLYGRVNRMLFEYMCLSYSRWLRPTCTVFLLGSSCKCRGQ